MGNHHQGREVQVNEKKVTKKAQREILKDIRRQVRWIEEAIKDGDQGWIDQYSNQLAATAGSLHSEDY